MPTAQIQIEHGEAKHGSTADPLAAYDEAAAERHLPAFTSLFQEALHT